MSEFEIVDLYIKNRKKEKGNKIQIFKEVKSNQKSIDLVEFIKTKNGLGAGHAIEFKVYNWRIGFEQSLGNRVLMPYNSLAIWNKFEAKIKREELINEGIGLIIVYEDKNCIELLPRKSKFLINSSYKKIRDKIKKRID